MKILAFDSSGLVASVAIVQDDNLIAEYTTNYKKTHSQTLLPMLDEVVRMTETDKKSFDLLAVAAGPGSFTGLRIGSATVKGLALAWDIPVVAVPTLEALAYNAWGSRRIICPIMDARRRQVYTGLYRFDKDDKMEVLMDQVPMDIDELIEVLGDRGEEVLFVGDGIDVYADTIRQKMTVPFSFAPAHMNKQRAGSVAVAAKKRYEEGIYTSGDDFAPEYLRQSQAERERAERQKAGRTANE
jgi:tRNA threonylcarbamoyladenosine biosynthesis protein TsaB